MDFVGDIELMGVPPVPPPTRKNPDGKQQIIGFRETLAPFLVECLASYSNFDIVSSPLGYSTINVSSKLTFSKGSVCFKV